MKETPSYYAVIPANVRYSKEVSDGAKLLYGEITCLCNDKGYCWASNAYFADLYGASGRTVSRWISELAAAGFIASLVDSATANSRKIWLAQPVLDTPKLSTPMDKNVYTTRQKRLHPMDKNVYHNNKENNKDNIKERMRGEKSPPPAPAKKPIQDFLVSKFEADLEAKKNAPSPIPAAPFPAHSDKPRDVETDTDLLTQVQEYYKANPREWSDGVCQVQPGKFTAAQLKTMLEDYCCHAFANRNKYATFAAHGANFKRWIRQQSQFERPNAFPAKTNKLRTIEHEPGGYLPQDQQLF